MRESMMLILKKTINRLLKFFQISRIPTKEKVVYLTFDDGPEPGICEFVLDELKKYGFKATFFCRGDNAERYPELLNRIKVEGHAIGNHTYSHLHAYTTSPENYVEDIEKANQILHSSLLRPPFGCLNFVAWLKLRSNYKMVYWSLSSGDSNLETFDYEYCLNQLKNKTTNGSVVLFHFCNLHERETRMILPAYCEWLINNGFSSTLIKL